MSEPINLSGRQKVLYEDLANRSVPLSCIYLGVVHVIADESNPDRLALAAHGVREMMDYLPSSLNLAVRFSKERLSDKVNEIIKLWANTASKSSCRTSKGWSGDIDPSLRKFLSKFEEFLKWNEQHRPRRSIAAKQVLRTFDVMPLALPAPLEDLRLRKWDDLHDYFTNVLHHRVQPEIGEFLQAMEAFELFLLDRFQPRTFEDFTAIDTLIQEGETHD